MGLLVLFSSFFYLFKNKKDIFSWCVLVFIIIHSLIGHKEERFIFPLVFCLPLVLLYSFKSFKIFQTKVFLFCFITMNLGLAAYTCTRIAKIEVFLLKEFSRVKASESKLFYDSERAFVAYDTYGLKNTFYHRNKDRVAFVKTTGFTKLNKENLKGLSTIFIQTKKDNPFKRNKYLEKRCTEIYRVIPHWVTLIKLSFLPDKDYKRVKSIYRCDCKPH